MKAIAISLGMLFSVAASADELKKIDETPAWNILQSIDSMTDKKECVAFLKSNSKVQYSGDTFSVGGLSWPNSYQYRIDDMKASELMFATDIEKRIGAIVLADKTVVRKIAGASRFRMKVTSGKTEDYDVNVSELALVDKKFQSDQCR